MGVADELLLAFAISCVLAGVQLGMIAHKAGHSRENGLFAFIPFGVLVAVGMPPHGRRQTVPLRPEAGGR